MVTYLLLKNSRLHIFFCNNVKALVRLQKNTYFCIRVCPDGGIGRRAGLKHQWIHFHAGSIPAPGTLQMQKNPHNQLIVGVFKFDYFGGAYKSNILASIINNFTFFPNQPPHTLPSKNQADPHPGLTNTSHFHTHKSEAAQQQLPATKAHSA